LCCLLVNGWETVQCCYEDTSSCSKRLVVLHLQLNLASPRAAASVCSPAAFSPAPVSTCICPIGMAVHSYTHLPATPSACPLGANGIRRPGFPPQLIHPIKTILPHIETLPLRDGARMPPFRSSLIADPFTQKCSVPIVRLFVMHTSPQTSACSALTSRRCPL
jgi:hypothetical protein